MQAGPLAGFSERPRAFEAPVAPDRAQPHFTRQRLPCLAGAPLEPVSEDPGLRTATRDLEIQAAAVTIHSGRLCLGNLKGRELSCLPSYPPRYPHAKAGFRQTSADEQGCSNQESVVATKQPAPIRHERQQNPGRAAERRGQLDRQAKPLIEVLDRGERLVVEWKVDGLPRLR